jgi:Uma2 family endonuclease
MVAKVPNAPELLTLADVHERLGFVDLHRIRAKPFPGSATEADLLEALENDEGKRYELVDGYIVEKEPMGWKEALWAHFLGRVLGNYTDDHDLGVVIGADGPYRLRVGLVRLPDISFVPWSRMPNDEAPDVSICTAIPTLAVEVLSQSNRAGEIQQKLKDYFAAGVKLVWVIDPKKKSATVYTSPTKGTILDETGVLEGGRVLPGFRLPLADLFAAGKRKRKKK